MSKAYEKSNEALAILAQRGCEVVREKARDLLLRRNEGLIYDKALTYQCFLDEAENEYILRRGILTIIAADGRVY